MKILTQVILVSMCVSVAIVHQFQLPPSYLI